LSATREEQYGALLRVRDEVGVTRLGLMTNQVWHDDPRRLVFMLARYKFVAKMLAGKKRVAEVGCGDAFGARIVLQEVGEVHAFDFDPLFIADVNARHDPRWPIAGTVHDILDDPLPGAPFDAVYGLDVMEHIAPEHEDRYLANLGRSLAPHGVLVVGMPSLESQAHASPQSKAGHVNCKSGPALKTVLARHFHNVFLFSMNDEVVHTGFSPMAHYLIGLCCAPVSP
jgi:SAM-dependent methyltransferase